MPRKPGDTNYSEREHKMAANLSMEKAKRVALKKQNADLKKQLKAAK